MKPLEIKCSGGVFVVRPWPTISTFIMLIVLISLGTWQIQRLHWKQNLIQQIDARLDKAPVDVTTITDPQNAEYLPITASGVFQPGQELYLHAISLKGEAGYHVLSPLKLNSGGYLLVDRGWVPLDRRDPQARAEGENYSATVVGGLLRLPHHHWMQPKNHPESNDWYGYDLTAMADNLGLPEFLPFILEANAAPNDGGFPVGGQTHVELPNNHAVYAFIWFSLALALLIIYGVQGWRKLS